MYNPDIFTVSLNIKSKAYHNKKHLHISESQEAFYIARFLVDYFHYKEINLTKAQVFIFITLWYIKFFLMSSENS